uniref:Putative zinc finger protein CONSTANS-LIKE 13 n=1 Tax=Davidia involucrata TaxID=16924 RepID=A0A5B6YWP3_DAVIN
MTDSPTRPHAQVIKEKRERVVQEDEEQQNMRTQNRICDFCGESLALLYCRADAAKLCLACDREVHSTNQLFTKHTRSQLCDACDSSPASILCSTENSILCQNCDWERHSRSLTSLHDRRPLEGFTGCPSVTELLTIVGFDDVGNKALFASDGLVGSGVYGSIDAGDGFADLLVWDTPSIVSLDDLIASTDSEHNFQAMGVLPPPKNRNAGCGQYKEEILSQLRGLAKLEPDFNHGHGDIESLVEFQSLVPEHDRKPETMRAEPAAIHSYEWCSDNGELANQGLQSMLLGSYTEESCLVPDKDSEIGGNVSHADGDHEGQSHHHIVAEPLQVLPKVAVRELTSQERDSALSRYKEKKKNRRYDKHIRYESRKARAECRIRIKGRFAKMDH